MEVTKGGMIMTQDNPNKNDLNNFTDTGTWHRHWFISKMCYTDGIKYVADRGGAYWLIDEICFLQVKTAIKSEGFQVWKLKVKPNNSAKLICEDGNDHVVFSKSIPYTDFPLDEITLYFCNNVLMLPREY